MKRIFSAIFTIILTITLILNFLGGFIGGIWLIIIGHWDLIFYGLIGGLVMPHAYSLVSLPGTALCMFSIKLLEKNKKTLSMIVMTFGSLFDMILIGGWIVFVYMIFVSRCFPENPIPFLLWGYTIATGPISYMASKEPGDSLGSMAGSFFATISFYILIAYHFIGGPIFVWIIAIALLGLTNSILLTITALSEHDEYRINFDENYKA